MLTKLTILDALRRMGYQFIGKGMFSVVFQNSAYPDRVIKVGGLGDAWPLYVLWARQKGYLGTFAPMVYSFKIHQDCYVASCEALKPLPSEDKLYRLVDRLASFSLPAPYSGFCMSLKVFISSGRVRRDIGIQNVMLRQQGDVMVINDPVYAPDESVREESFSELAAMYARREPFACKLIRPCPWQDIQIDLSQNIRIGQDA